MEDEKKGYLEWLFSRWYLYSIVFTYLIVVPSPDPFSLVFEIRRFIGTFLFVAFIISICVGLKKLFNKIRKLFK